MWIVITVIILVVVICGGLYLWSESKVDALRGDVYTALGINGLSYTSTSSLGYIDVPVYVNSSRAVDSFDTLNFFKTHNPQLAKNTITAKQTYCEMLRQFIGSGEFSDRYGYSTVIDELNDNIAVANEDNYCIYVSYTSPAGRKTNNRIVSVPLHYINNLIANPQLLMTKTEIKKQSKQLQVEQLEAKRNRRYDAVNGIIDSVNDAKDHIIIVGDSEKLDTLIQTLIGKTVGWISKVKTFDSKDWTLIDSFISNIKQDVDTILSNNQRIADYYESQEFADVRDACSTLMESQKEFNEYIGEKAKDIQTLFGVRASRNETETNDAYNYVHTYKKSITPFTAEVSATVFSSAENNPIEYVVKYFYSDKSKYTEQIQKLHVLVEELETLREAKQIIDAYKSDYKQYIKNVPSFILVDDEAGFYERLGFARIDERTLTVQYRFNYTSDGGKAQRSFTVPMTEETIEQLISILERKLTQTEFSKEQRRMMTPKLREAIKVRDNYTCRYCGNSTFNEPNLLLEIDHIIPVAKGGFTVEENLQTLCWKCNRSKSDKV